MKVDILYNNGKSENIDIPKEDFTEDMKNGIIQLTETVFNKSAGAGYFTLTVGQETYIVKLADVSRIKIIEGDSK